MVAAMAISSPTFSSLSTLHHRLHPTKTHFLHSSSSSASSSFSHPLRASEPERNSNSTTISSLQEEDAGYLVKLAAGSVIGAAVIKYGCVVLPEVTTPDLGRALAIISAPAVASVILMVLASRRE